MQFTKSLLQSLAITTAMLVFATPPAMAEDAATIPTGDAETARITDAKIRPVRTDSPRDTLITFLHLRDDGETALLAYRDEPSAKGAELINLIAERFSALIDLSEVPRAKRQEVGYDTVTFLLDIFGRVELPNLKDVPDAEAFGDKGPAEYRVPGTPIRITRINEGPRKGEFLFNAFTVRAAPRFYQGIEDLPLRSRLGITSWSSAMPQLTGPLIPSAVVAAMPENLRAPWHGTPIWKVIATISVALIAVLLFARIHRWLSRAEHGTRIGALSWRLMRPISVLVMVGLLVQIVQRQLYVAGVFSKVVDATETILVYGSAAWLFWLASRLFIEWIILSPRIPEESLDANFLRLVAGSVGVVGFTVILALGGQALGLPILTMLAGLGIGGLAVALAIRPTLENLIGGVILYIDKPVRVGDYCTFGDKTGTVESIGIRSTQIRGLDRTLISIPNSQFADMEIINWARCDEMLINETIGVRYETTPDQLRYALAKLREMLHSHPRINSETVRVRFSGYGDSSLNITIRVYAMTREWNDFHAIREDVFLRTYDIITEAGTGFAFPSHTIYMGKDSGLDEETGKKAMERVQAWRRSGQLPFPRFSPERLERIDDTLDYPPRGSPEADQEDLEAAAGAERLSAEPLPDEQPAAEPAEQKEGKERT